MKTIVLVPTMGFFHEGHLSLMRKARTMGDVVVVSVFVNPTQFGPGEDFERYPRDFDRDAALAKDEGVDILFAPSASDLYGQHFQTSVILKTLPNHLCGRSRPTHFKGVATIVMKLFHIAQPHIAVFGQKDYQQLLIIRRMVEDMNLDIRIVGGPIVREPDGLAMSSRNSYLATEQRASARFIYQSLQKARSLVDTGTLRAAELIAAAIEVITAHSHTTIDYVVVCDPETLESVEVIEGPVLMALAVKVGKTRLIDNMIINP